MVFLVRKDCVDIIFKIKRGFISQSAYTYFLKIACSLWLGKLFLIDLSACVINMWYLQNLRKYILY